MNLRVLLEKDGVYGVIGLAEYRGHYVLTSQSGHSPQPFVQVERNLADGKAKFDEALATSRDRGWTILYYGRPLNG